MAGPDPYAAMASPEAGDPYAAIGSSEASIPAPLHTYAARKRDGTVVHFQAPADAADEAIRAQAAHETGDDAYLRPGVVDRTGQELPKTDTSAWHGLELGALKPIDNLASWAGQLPGLRQLDEAFSSLTGAPTADEAVTHNEAARANNTRGGWQGVGNVIGTIPTLELPGGVLAQGAAGGALLSNAHDLGGVALDAGLGAAGGAVGAKLLSGLGGVVAPRLSAARTALRDAGVQFTPGQLIGGVAKHIEDASTHLPFVGDAITAARRRGLGQFARGAVNDALGHIGESVPDRIETGHGAIAYAKKAFGDGYDRVLARTTIRPDQQFATDLQAVANRANDGTLSSDAGQQLEKTVNNVIAHRMMTSPTLSGDAVKSIVSELRTRAGAATDPAYKGVLQELTTAVRSAAARSSPPDVASDLAALGHGYAKYAVLRRAAAAPESGIFTPAQLQTASRATDTSIGKGASATGEALLQPYAEAGREVLPSKVADSGTGHRLGVNSVAGSLASGALLANPGSTAAAALGVGAGSALYSRPVIDLLNTAFARKAGPTAQNSANLLRLLAPLAGVAGTAAVPATASPAQ